MISHRQADFQDFLKMRREPKNVQLYLVWENDKMELHLGKIDSSAKTKGLSYLLAALQIPLQEAGFAYKSNGVWEWRDLPVASHVASEQMTVVNIALGKRDYFGFPILQRKPAERDGGIVTKLEAHINLIFDPQKYLMND